MKVLIAEDDRISRGVLTASLTNSGYDVVAVEDGEQAWELMKKKDSPRMAVVDWMMPRMDGLELCRKLRQSNGGEYFYIVLLTTRSQQEEIVEGLAAGADDYLTKPYNPQELRLRLHAGARILKLQLALREKVTQLEDAIEEVKQLQGLLPICMHCKSIRDAQNVWHRLEVYFSQHAEVRFSHGLCDSCLKRHYPELQAPERGESSTVSSEEQV